MLARRNPTILPQKTENMLVMIRHLLWIGMLAAALAQDAGSGAMTAEERGLLVDHMRRTHDALRASIRGLTPEQWNFKPDAATWSVANVAEHLILTEGYFQKANRDLLATPARPRSATPEADQRILHQIEDRSKKAKAPEMLVPTGKWTTVAEADSEFAERRASTIGYLQSTSDALRTHFSGGNSKMDVYQYFLLVTAHTARHTRQIEELKSHPAFPK